MEMAGFALGVVAIVLLYAVHLGRDVRLNIRLPGTDASLEVRDQHGDPTSSVEAAVVQRREGPKRPRPTLDSWTIGRRYRSGQGR